MNAERILPVGGAELRVQTFGDPAHPALLLIADGSGDRWDEEFCARLADGLRFVLRYDERATAGPPGETGADPAHHALEILDAFDTGPAHLVGIAGGADLALRLGVHHPERVASLTLIRPPVDSPRTRVGEIGVPTLVVPDPADPLAHAEALAREIPGAELLPLPGVGRTPARDTLLPALLRHTSGGWDPQAERLAARYLAAGDPAGWFDPLYRAATHGEVAMPWDRAEPHPLLAQWADGRDGTGRRAVVIGCGLGADAEFLAGLGYDTVGFDIAPAAVAIARERHPDTAVDYAVADLLALPEHWRQGFDLVVDIYTVQALPRDVRPAAMAGVGSLVAPGGTLLVIQVCFEESRGIDGPPWPLRRDEIDAFAVDGLTPVRVEQVAEPGRSIPRWRAEFIRSAED